MGNKKKKTWRRVKSISPMSVISPFIMKNRIGSQNFMRDSIAINNMEKYIREKQSEGMTNFSMMHVLIAAYIRLCSQRPQINRFIRGQRVYTRSDIEVSLTIKKEMSIESPDTVVKTVFEPDATAECVYNEINRVISEYRENPGGDFDDTARVLSYVPALVLKFAIWFLNLLDYFGGIPKFLTRVSPFHCSMFITSMGSLGIPPIYHHLYDFGTCPAFVSFGSKRRRYEVNPDGSVYQFRYIDLAFVLDERICDGYYYASALKLFKSYLKNPWQLDVPPETVVEDQP